MKRTNSGVTLIALIITIIVLLILAGVTIAMVVGDNGVLNRAADAATETEQASIKEAMDLAYSDYQLEFVNMYLEEGNSTRVASLSVVEVDRYAEAVSGTPNPLSSFGNYLIYEKECMDVNGVINVEKLVGSELSTGKGSAEEGTDIYVLEETESKCILTYYDDNSNSEEIWQVSKYSTKTVEIKYVDTDEVAFEIEYIEGMTWGDWIESEFNTIGMYYTDYSRWNVFYQKPDEEAYRVEILNDEGVIFVKDNDMIIEGENYVLDNNPVES